MIIPVCKLSVSKETILIVDDEQDILELVRYNLSREGYSVICAETGEDALELVQSQPVDVIILDLMLPGIDGLEVARRLKAKPAWRQKPLIMLTAKGAETDVVTGLELGADDYVTKPFSPRVLLARLRAVIRRRQAVSESSEADPHILEVGGLYIDGGRRQVRAADIQIQLTYTEFQILQVLARRPGWVYTRSQLVDLIRGADYPVTDRSVDVQIAGLRKKLGDCGHLIETVRGVGYRFSELAT